MKFINFKIIAMVILVTLSVISATKFSVKRSETEDGSGSWDNGFVCPKLFIDGADQGEVKILPKGIVDPTGDNVYGLLLQFTNAPKSQLKKVARDLGGNKWRIQYRKTLNSFTYTNPSGNKFIAGNVQDEQGKQYTFKLLLPWKMFGWYINDTEGNKIVTALNMNSTLRTSMVIHYKAVLRNNFFNYVDANSKINALTKNKADYEKYIATKKEKLSKLQGAIEGLRTKGKEAEKTFDTKTNELLDANSKLRALMIQDAELASKKQAIDDSLKAIEGDQGKAVKTKAAFAKGVEDVKKILDAEYAKLLKYAPQKTADINASKTGLYASDVNAYKKIHNVYP